MEEKSSQTMAVSNLPQGEYQSKRHRGGLIEWVDVISKAIIAIAGLLLTGLGYMYQQSSAATDLLLQQERGDIQIRAEMFGKITERLMKPSPKKEDTVIEDALLVQVLALNFHELIELKPLMLHLDDRLTRKIDDHNLDPNDLDEYLKSRSNLRSIARRVRSRQVSALTSSLEKNGGEEMKLLDQAKIQFISVTEKHVKKERNALNACYVNGYDIAFDSLVSLDGFDKNSNALITVNKPSADNWKNESFNINLTQTSSTEVTETTGTDFDDSYSQYSVDRRIEFTVTPYDLPFVDNTIDSNGNRYAIYIDQVCTNTGTDDKQPNSVRLALLYFPKNFYPTRDRPVNYKQIKEKIKGSNDRTLLGLI